MSIIIGKAGVNREVKEIYQPAGGVNRKIMQRSQGSDGVNRLVYPNRTYLLENGVDNTAITGGYKIVKGPTYGTGSWGYSSDSAGAFLYVDFTSNTSGYAGEYYVSTVNKISTQHTKLCIDLYLDNTDGYNRRLIEYKGVMLMSPSSIERSVKEMIINPAVAETVITFDCQSVIKNHYRKLKVYNMWLE